MTHDTSSSLIWQNPEIIRWSQIMTNSYQKLLGKNLINSVNTPEQISAALFHAPFALVSHGTQANPIFNYGNQTALQLWSLSWEKFTSTPSAHSAEPVARAERKTMLNQAAKTGYVDNYQGVRISSQGQRFLIKQGIIWNLTDESGQKCGQAATFSTWKWLASKS